MKTEVMKDAAMISLKLFAGILGTDAAIGLTRSFIKAGPNGQASTKGFFFTYTVGRGVAA